MSKRKDVFNSPEYRHIEEHLDEILNELEGDEETRDMTMPEAWDQDFREVLERVKKEKKQRHRRRFCRTLAAAAAAVIVLVPVIGFLGPETVEGDGIMELFEKTFVMNGKRYEMTGTNEDGLNVVDNQNPNEKFFPATNIEELNKQIAQELKHPFYKVEWVPENFEVKDAIYNTVFDTLNIELSDGKKYIYISQQFIVDFETQSNITQDEKMGGVENVELNIPIEIYKSQTDKGLSFSIVKNNTRLDCYMETEFEECKRLAESIIYGK